MNENSECLAGSTGSRLLDGNSSEHSALEDRLARFHNAPSALLFNSGFDANAGIFACLPQPGDAIVYDEYVHASVHDGMRLSRVKSCRRIPFAHNNLTQLDTILSRETGLGNVFVAVESLYSMDGDVAPLTEIVALSEKYPNVYVILDEAHATGVYGQRGCGIANALDVEQRIFIRLHTFGKAIASNGAVVLCSKVVRDYLINYARPLIFSTSLARFMLLSINCSYDVLEYGDIDNIQSQLHSLCRHLHRQLSTLPATSSLTLPPNEWTRLPPSPIIPILTTQPRVLSRYLIDAGFVIRPIAYPTVPKGGERIRVCLHAGNTTTEVDALVAALKRWIESQSSTVQTRSQTETLSFAKL